VQANQTQLLNAELRLQAENSFRIEKHLTNLKLQKGSNNVREELKKT
jgi:hypothetical protein